MPISLKNNAIQIKDGQSYSNIDAFFLGDVSETVNEYLEEHPSILTQSTYVTPEMYGAKGNGTADDTDAVQSAFNSKCVVLLTGEYKIFDTLVLPNNLVVYGNSTRNNTKFNLNFDTSVKACMNIDHPEDSRASYVVFHSVGFKGVNTYNQGAFVSTGSNNVLSLFNCIVSSFDAVFVGGFSISRVSECTFYRIGKALFFSKIIDEETYSYQTHQDLYDAISSQVTGNIFGAVWESSITDCYISGQGSIYENVGLFVGGNPIDVKISNCYIDYWSACIIDVYTYDMRSEPIVFNNCTVDSIITLKQTAKSDGAFSAQGIRFLSCLFVRFNASFDDNVTVPIYDFIYNQTGTYNLISVEIDNCNYTQSTSNTDLSAYKFINIVGGTCQLKNCIFDFKIATTLSGIGIDDIVAISYYATDKSNKFPILNYKEYSSMPTVALSGASQSFNGHIFTYSGDVYMNVNGTATRINT